MSAVTFSVPTLETERLIMRAPQQSDFAAEAEFFASDAAQFVGGSKRPDEAWRSLASLIGHWVMRGYGFWGLQEKASGAYVGRCGLWNPLGWPEPEIGWSLMRNGTGKGYATEAGLAARNYAYDVLGWTTAISLIDPKNKPSEAVATRLGATFDTTYEHPAFGTMYIWRHPGPDDLKKDA